MRAKSEKDVAVLLDVPLSEDLRWKNQALFLPCTLGSNSRPIEVVVEKVAAAAGPGGVRFSDREGRRRRRGLRRGGHVAALHQRGCEEGSTILLMLITLIASNDYWWAFPIIREGTVSRSCECLC